jgi:proteasome lid subunit RPN8/RPN11
MSSAEFDSDNGVGSVDELPLPVDYAIPVIEEIAACAVDGLYRFRHGGVEVGGVLFGAFDADGVKISAFRPLECEHAFGPRFVLSERDRAAFKQLLELPRTDPKLRGMVPVGWYHSHTRSGIALSPRDLEIYDRFFPQPWQVALVLRPESYRVARASFFARKRDGSLHDIASCEEFLVHSRRGPAEPEEPEPVEETPAPAPPPVQPPVKKAAPPPRPAPPTLAREIELEPEALPSFAHQPAPPSRRRWVWVSMAILLALAGGAAVEAYSRMNEPQPALSLWVADIGGQLLIEWDRSAKPIRDAKDATLEILDGDKRTVLPIDGDRLREGSVDYARHAEIVDVRLRVHPATGQPAQEFIRFVGPPVHRPPSAEESKIRQERDALQAEVESLRTELQRKNAQLRRARAARANP